VFLEEHYGQMNQPPVMDAAISPAGVLVKVLIAGRWQDAANMDPAGLPWNLQGLCERRSGLV
jgi:hypothetical protein